MMALWPNNRVDIIGFKPMGLSAYLAFQGCQQRTFLNLSYFANETIADTSSVPEGSFQSPACIIAPIVSGGMSSGDREVLSTLSGGLNLLSGGQVSGAADFDMDATGSAGLITSVSGSADFSGACDGGVSLTIALDGDASYSGSASGQLGMHVGVDGSASMAASADADLRGIASLGGDITPYTELSPENLALAVWRSILESDLSAGDMMRIFAAYSAGNATGLDSDAITFESLDGSKNRIEGTIVGGIRTVTTVDGSNG
jgi:hypothetical protein